MRDEAAVLPAVDRILPQALVSGPGERVFTVETIAKLEFMDFTVVVLPHENIEVPGGEPAAMEAAWVLLLGFDFP